MLLLAAVRTLPPQEATYWWVALGVGLAVVLVVIAVLSMLELLVRDIDRGVQGVREVASGISRNTSSLSQFFGTAAGVQALLTEALEHKAFLEKTLSAVRKS
jgi:hypothetical protein